VTDIPDAPAPPARYTLPAILFHWTSFALVVFVGVLGLLFGSIPRPNRLFWINIHAVVGLAVLALAMARVFWRLRSPPPGPLKRPSVPTGAGYFYMRARR
jgi:cytochrome b561